MSPVDGDRRSPYSNYSPRPSCPFSVLLPPEKGTPHSTRPTRAEFALDQCSPSEYVRVAKRRTHLPQKYHSHYATFPPLSHVASILLLVRVAECLIPAETQLSLNRSSELQVTLQPPVDAHHSHHSHLHFTKLLFPLASSSLNSKSFKPTITPNSPLASINLTSETSFSPNRYSIGRKRKRELFAFAISDEQPLKTLGSDAFWSESAVASHRRRINSFSGIVPSSLALHSNKQKPSSSAVMGHGPFSSLTSSSAGLPSSLGGANVAGNMRMKIMLSPPGFGTGLVPDQKCNFELYPSGCFDENGSICDTSGSGLCVCRPGYSIRIGSVYCLRPAAIGEACYTTEQCESKVSHSGCFNYREEYREENPSAFFGPSQSSWPMGECRCRIGHRYDEDQKACVRSLIGSWCSNVWDCEMVPDEDQKSGEGHHESSLSGHRAHSNHTRLGGLANPNTYWHGHSTTSRAKMANIVCEHNICNCSQFFYYNSSAEECQFVETFGQACRPNPDSQLHTKRNIRSRSSSPLQSSSYTSRRRQSPYHTRQLRSLPDDLITCNLPTVCSSNGTCICAEGYEHQESQTPQCQSISKGVGGHITHYFHSGSSGRSSTKDHGVTMYDRGAHYGEGQSNVSNFVEYVLYVLVPALVVIFMFKPCFRRIGEWRNHVHQYSSDSDFYLATNGLPPVIAEVNVIAPGDKTVGTGQFASFLPHMGCHNAYIFESADGCYAYGTGCLTPGSNAAATNDPSIALVREKLQTIEETQSEEGNLDQCSNCVATDSRPSCCMSSTPPLVNSAPNDLLRSPSTEDALGTNDDKQPLENKGDGIEMMQFNKPDPPTTFPKDEGNETEKVESTFGPSA